MAADDTQVLDILKETRRNLNAGKIVFTRGNEEKGFELERELGSGGMGVVWLARDLDVEGRVALKFLPGLVRDPVAERDLRDEVKNARDLVHENIVAVRRLHKDENSIAIEMEYVDGPSVSRLIADSDNCWLDPEKAAPIIRGLCLAIDYAWKPPRRLVHRDVKPLNLLLNAHGVVKVVDFGIAHSVSETVARLTNLDSAKRVVGSLPYMSPQQLKGEILHQNDVYSIGATIYELLTGTAPFRAKDIASLTQQIAHETPVPMAERRRQIVAEKNRTVSGSVGLPKVWEEVVAACLAKDAAKRPQSAREVAVRLGLVAGGATVMPWGPGGTGAPAKKRSKQVWIGAAAAVVLAGIGLGVWMQRPPRANSGSLEKKTEKKVVPIQIPIVPPKITQTVQTSDANQQTVERKSVDSITLVQPRQSWSLTATSPTRVVVSDTGGTVLFDGPLSPGVKRTLEVDKPLTVEVKEGGGLTLEIDGQTKTPEPVDSNRWVMTVPSARDTPISIEKAPSPPPPFEAEIGPLVKAGKVNQPEAEWIRAALGGKKGDVEGSLVKRIFAKDDALPVHQWRARTAMEFPPDPAALRATDLLKAQRAVDLVLPPGGEKIRLLRIEPGSFQKGSPAGERGRLPNELEPAPVKIAKPYFIGIYEVTNKQFLSVLRRVPSWFSRNLDGPVEQVKWSDIMGPTGFVKKLDEELARLHEGVLSADLPTDHEWEYACRAATTTAFNNGRNLEHLETDAALNQIAHYNKASGGPRSVGELLPNAWGLHDMHGNVQEWTSDLYLRGGSWQSKPASCRSASRVVGNRDTSQTNQTGFRLVLRLRESTAAR
jgi:serine/threonine protein kinase